MLTGHWVLYSLILVTHCVQSTTPCGSMVLLLPGPTWGSLNFIKSTDDSNRFEILGKPIYIQADEDESREKPSPHLHQIRTAFTIWDASLILSKFLEHQQLKAEAWCNHPTANTYNVRFKSVLELGSGRGIVGMTASLLGAKNTVLTDVHQVVPDLERILELNEFTSMQDKEISVEVLDWTKAAHVTGDWDMIVAADVIWVENLVEPLVETISALSNPSTRILLAYHSRSEKTFRRFMQLISARQFQVNPIPASELHPVYRKDAVTLYDIFKE